MQIRNKTRMYQKEITMLGVGRIRDLFFFGEDLETIDSSLTVAKVESITKCLFCGSEPIEQKPHYTISCRQNSAKIQVCDNCDFLVAIYIRGEYNFVLPLEYLGKKSYLSVGLIEDKNNRALGGLFFFKYSIKEKNKESTYISTEDGQGYASINEAFIAGLNLILSKFGRN